MSLEVSVAGEASVARSLSLSHSLSHSPPRSPNARARRRTRKRDGPPQYQFLTATNPSEFKGETAKRNVRSQAMIHHRYKADQAKKRGKESLVPAVAVAAKPTRERIVPVLQTAPSYENRPSPLMTHALDPDLRYEPQRIYHSTSAAWLATNPDDGFGGASLQVQSVPSSPIRSPRYLRALSQGPDTGGKKVTDYDESDNHEDTQLHLLLSEWATAWHIGDGVDPFHVMPQFSSPELSSVDLVRKCNRAFVSSSTMTRWVPTMLAHRHILLSSTTLASCWLDMHAGKSGDSKRTMLVKGEIISWINERLRNPDTKFQDFTLMVILHLLAGEMWSCDERVLRIHETGVAELITQRGGMDSLGGNGALAEVAASCCFHTDILCEATPLPLFSNWTPPQFAPSSETEAIPESPLFCPRSDLSAIARDPHCAEMTYDLLCDMRDLTDLFLAYNKGLDAVYDLETSEDSVPQGILASEYDTKVAGIRARLAALPSACAPGTPVTNDWVYESCRIASIIYASAIIMRVPFSVAAEPGRSVILADAASFNSSPTSNHSCVRLTDALYEVLERSNMETVWGDMSGVLYWISLVGAAAARVPASINMSQYARARWVQRCLIMFATRVMIILIFQHPLPVIMAQKTLLKVQELIGRDHSSPVHGLGRLVSEDEFII